MSAIGEKTGPDSDKCLSWCIKAVFLNIYCFAFFFLIQEKYLESK